MKYIIKKATRRKINRSGQYPCQICNKPLILVEHHINGRNIEKYNAWWNLTNICDNCHRLTHEGKIIIEKWVSTTAGRKLLWHYKNEESVTGQDSTPYLIPNEKTQVDWLKDSIDDMSQRIDDLIRK